MTLRFTGVCVLIHVNCQNHSHKTRIMTNPNSYGLNSILISCHLAAQGPTIASKLLCNTLRTLRTHMQSQLQLEWAQYMSTQ